MIEIEFLADFCCYQKGQRKLVSDGFGQIMIEEGKAKVVKKQVKEAMKDKMVRNAEDK